MIEIYFASVGIVNFLYVVFLVRYYIPQKIDSYVKMKKYQINIFELFDSNMFSMLFVNFIPIINIFMGLGFFVLILKGILYETIIK